LRPKAETQKEARQRIIRDFKKGLDRALGEIYDEASGYPRQYQNLQRDARRTVLRHIHHLNATMILDYEAGYPVTSPDGTPLEDKGAARRLEECDYDIESSEVTVRSIDLAIDEFAGRIGLDIYRVPRGNPGSNREP
jgi:hypothetical protein